MRIKCPLCGSRDMREFTCRGAAQKTPAMEAGSEVWHEHVHLRDNPAGEVREFWQHTMGCGAWLVVTRNTVTHDVVGAQLAEHSGMGVASGLQPTGSSDIGGEA